jgi:hypothetical protein
VRFVSDRGVYEEGQFIWLYLDVRNVSDKPIAVADGHSLKGRLRLTDSRGQAVRAVEKLSPGNVGIQAVPPGKQVDLMLFFVCGNPYAMFSQLKPGSYRASWAPKEGETVRGAMSGGPERGEGRLAPACEAAFRVVPRKPSEQQPVGKPVRVPWGKAVGGLRTRLRSDRPVFASGAPIPIVVEVENTSDATLHYHVPQVAVNGRIRVLDSKERPVPYIGMMAQTMNPLRPLEPNATGLLDAADLADYYYLRKPGKYSAQWPGARAWGKRGELAISGVPDMAERPEDSALPATNVFRFEVFPPERSDPFEEALGTLLAKRPKEWCVELSPSVSATGRIGGRWSRVPRRRYSFEHRNMFRNQYKDSLQIHTVCVAIASERAVEEPWHLSEKEAKRPVEYLGRGTYGHVYLTGPHASSLKHWPTVRADLIQWLGVEAGGK